RIRNMPRLVRDLHAAEAERLDAEQDAIESRLGFDSPAHASSNSASDQSQGHRIYLPSLEEIEALKRQIRAEKEQSGGPPHLKMYRQPKVFRTEYSQGRIGD